METTLYKRADSGKIQEWTIQVENDAYRTIAGLRGGQKVTSEWTVTETTNAGRSNERSGASQAQFEANAKITKKLEEGYCASIDDVDNAKVTAWKEPMLAFDIEKKPKALQKAGWLYIVQPKLDGKRCVGVANRQVMFSRNGKTINTLPLLAQQIMEVLLEVECRIGVSARLDGELYNHELRDDFAKIISLTSGKKELTFEEQQMIQYHVYDLDIPGKSYIERLAILQSVIDPGFHTLIKIVPWEVGLDNSYLTDDHMSYIEKLQMKYVDEGYEGAMVRLTEREYEHKRSDALLKVKSFQTDEFTILDILEGKGNRSGMAGKLVLDVPQTGNTSESGIAGGVSFYRDIWEDRFNLIGKKATVRYFGFTPDGKLRFPVTKQVDRDDI